jgi:polyhydroxyalkanoate synthase
MSDEHKSAEHGSYDIPDPEAFARNLAELARRTADLAALISTPQTVTSIEHQVSHAVSEGFGTFAPVLSAWLAKPRELIDLQAGIWKKQVDLWRNAARRASGEPVAPVAEPARGDRRFSDAEWSENPAFDFIKQLYLLAVSSAEELVEKAADVDPHTRNKARFYVRQIANALAPTNFIMTNPEVLRETLASNGQNLVRGIENLARDLERGGGELRIRQTDPDAFRVGENLATTPGKVVFENELFQLIQYAPSTDEVWEVPLLIIPPWINKYYILDLTEDKSFVRWAAGGGHTVFVVSWVNPDRRLSGRTFEDYMSEGILAALDTVLAITRAERANVIGYCVGGTLLAATLAWLAAHDDQRIASATFLAAQVDFTEAGDLEVFVDDAQLEELQRRAERDGYVDAAWMARTFNLLRSNDLIWSYVINNYLLGRDPVPFDLLHWNSDSTRMPAANHLFYLRECYQNNTLAKGEMELAGTRLDVGKVRVPVYSLATREDHIAPAGSVFLGARLFAGPVRYVVAGSGHIAGVINPPDRNKYQYWADGRGETFEEWIASATETPGSWWPDWLRWITPHCGGKVKARKPGSRKFRPIEDAPGSYVRVIAA